MTLRCDSGSRTRRTGSAIAIVNSAIFYSGSSTSKIGSAIKPQRILVRAKQNLLSLKRIRYHHSGSRTSHTQDPLSYRIRYRLGSAILQDPLSYGFQIDLFGTRSAKGGLADLVRLSGFLDMGMSDIDCMTDGITIEITHTNGHYSSAYSVKFSDSLWLK